MQISTPITYNKMEFRNNGTLTTGQVHEKNHRSIITETKVSISEEASSAIQREKDIARRYDVRSMTEKEMVSLAKELKEAGLISSKEHAVMSFPKDKARSNLGVHVDPNQKKDYLGESKGVLDFMMTSSASREEINIQKSIHSILKRLS